MKRFFSVGVSALWRDSSVLFLGMVVVYVLNFGFQVYMGRVLLPHEYAQLVSLLSFFNILLIPLGMVSLSVNRMVRLMVLKDMERSLGVIFIQWLRRLVFFGVFLGILFIFFQKSFSAYIPTTSLAWVVLFVSGLLVISLRPVVDGMILGLQDFGRFTLLNILCWATRLLVAFLCVQWLTTSTFAGVLGHVVGFGVSVIVGCIWLSKWYVKRTAENFELPQTNKFSFISVLVLLGYSVLMTADVILVKRFYPDEAGAFAYAATLGRLIIFIPQALIGAMFPKVVAVEEETREHRVLFYYSAGATLLLTSLGAITLYPIAEFLLVWIFGLEGDVNIAVGLCRKLSIAMVPIAMLNVMSRYLLAQSRWLEVLCIPIAAVVYVMATVIYVDSVDQLVMMIGIVGLVTAGLLAVMLIARPVK